MKSNMILPVIMAGGSGSRLWPMSRTHYPKQFLKLTSEKSMLQETLSRLETVEHLPVSLICNEEHRFLVAEQLRDAATQHSGILLEPFGRNTAPAVALSALHAIKNNNDPLLLVLAADHLIQDIPAFCTTVEKSKPLAVQGKLVTFGVVPTKPETGYGYIKSGKLLPCETGFLVDSFVEKPDIELAQQYFDAGSYYWNSGMFLFRASRYLEELGRYRPDILVSVEKAYSNSTFDLDFIRIDAQVFKDCPDDSIDYAVMERTKDAVVVPMEAGWSDIGSWSSLWEVGAKCENQNVVRGDVISHNTIRSYINSDEKLVATVGVKDLVIVDTKDAILVAHRDSVQDVKNIVNLLKENRRKEFEQHREVFRPWGRHDHISEGERYHVKKVVVKPGQKTALQLHYHRAEHWIVVSGTATVYKDDKQVILGENESIYIPVGTAHCFENPGKLPLEIIEVRTGSYLGEDDIVRFPCGDKEIGY